jgi:hypothetical protein
MVCRILGCVPSSLGEYDPYDINFLKAGLTWEIEQASKMGRGMLF